MSRRWGLVPACVLHVDLSILITREGEIEAGEIDHIGVEVGQGVTGWVAKHRQPVAIASAASKDPRFKAFKNIPEDDFEAMLCTPILCAGRVVGVINLQHRMSYRHTTEQVRLLSTLGLLVGAEIERARLESENTQLTGGLETCKAVDRAKSVLQRDLSPSTKKRLIKPCSERAGNDVNPCERSPTPSCWLRT
jgi:signal transduction protein with GAF and PtsI domain